MNARHKKILRTVLILSAASIGVGAGITLIVAVSSLDHLPPERLCQQQGYQAWDCGSPNQTLFDWVYDLSCVQKTLSYDCLTAPPPCCLGALDVNASWHVPLMPQIALGYSFVNLNQVSCRNYAKSVRAGTKRCGGRPPPCPYLNSTPVVSDTALDDFEKTAYHSCVQERLEAGYFFLYFTGPVLLVSCFLLGYAAWSTTKTQDPTRQLPVRLGTLSDRPGGGSSVYYKPNSSTRDSLSATGGRTNIPSTSVSNAFWNVWSQEPMSKFGIFFGTISAAILLEGIDVLLSLKHALGWEGAIPCVGKNSAYVIKGSYFNTFHCYDLTIGGTASIDPDYEWVTRHVTMFIVASVTGFLVIMVYVGILITTCNCAKPNPEEEDHPNASLNPYEDHSQQNLLASGSVESDRSRGARAKLKLVG